MKRGRRLVSHKRKPQKWPDYLFLTSMPGLKIQSAICDACITRGEVNKMDRLLSADSNACEVWEEGSEGWVAPPTCDRCGRVIPVIVNGGPDHQESP